ncbi:unnamed protein product [Phytophthora lilii]|uniref:Unnamed protein product n=1 Tax=Phytophthora lilii TaxID=2077276 RepID=A0A9W6TWX3_9STRA|nr:unnamed protein product [Phytophthora lilii]
MASTSSSPSISENAQHNPVTSPVRGLLNKLLGRNSCRDRALPRKLASMPFAASLLAPPLPPDEILQRRLQLQRIVDVVVLDATRDKKNDLVITLKLSLKPEAPRMPVGIFIPNNTPTTFEVTKTFYDANQLSKALSFCVDKSVSACGEDCEFCDKLRTYLRTHWTRDPLVTVVNMGDTVLRKPSLAVHLTQLVRFAAGKSVVAPRVAANTQEKGAMVVEVIHKLSPLRHGHENEKDTITARCAVQNKITVVVYDFFNIFSESWVQPAAMSFECTTSL